LKVGGGDGVIQGHLNAPLAISLTFILENVVIDKRKHALTYTTMISNNRPLI